MDFDFETPASFSGEVRVVVGVGACLASIGGYGGSTGVDVDVNEFISLVCILLADDGDDVDDDDSSALRRLPPFRDGDLNVEVLAASCCAKMSSSFASQSAAACTTIRGGSTPSSCTRAADALSFFAERLAINFERLRFAAFAALSAATAASSRCCASKAKATASACCCAAAAPLLDRLPTLC